MTHERSDDVSFSVSRRRLMKQGLLLGAAGVLDPRAASTVAAPPPTAPGALKEGDVILFQGDSVTDASRKKEMLAPNDGDALGRGYAAMIAGELLADYPGLGLQVYNRGISGNKVPDLAARWQEDAIALKPAILSILIGINDLWHTVAFGSKYKGTINDYEEGYRRLIEQSLAAIPGVRIILCEPFELRNWAAFDPYREVAGRLADKMKLTFVPFQSVFKKAAESKGTEGKFWAWDGIHPTIPGHTLMCRAWRRATGL